MSHLLISYPQRIHFSNISYCGLLSFTSYKYDQNLFVSNASEIFAIFPKRYLARVYFSFSIQNELYDCPWFYNRTAPHYTHLFYCNYLNIMSVYRIFVFSLARRAIHRIDSLVRGYYCPQTNSNRTRFTPDNYGRIIKLGKVRNYYYCRCC